MLLLPGAERERRALLLGAALLTSWALALWPQSAVDETVRVAVHRYGAPVARGAGWLEAWLRAGSRAPASPAPERTLEALERAAAMPPPISGGLVWIEVPVRERDPSAGELLLAAGSRLGLGEGMVVACGQHYVGRIVGVTADAALVRGVSAADERTGVAVQGAEAAGECIAIGRGRQGSPVLNWIAAGGEPEEDGHEVFFRGRGSDPPALAALGLRLGRAVRQGDAARGDLVWAIEGGWPAAAEGRVCVAAGALPAEPVHAPELLRAPAPPRLAADGVFGAQASCWEAPAGFPPAALLRSGRIVGPVIVAGGGAAWVRADPPAAWGAAAVAIGRDRFTRGGGGIPRGLWIGREGEAPPSTGAAEFVRLPAAARPQP